MNKIPKDNIKALLEGKEFLSNHTLNPQTLFFLVIFEGSIVINEDYEDTQKCLIIGWNQFSKN